MPNRTPTAFQEEDVLELACRLDLVLVEVLFVVALDVGIGDLHFVIRHQCVRIERRIRARVLVVLVDEPLMQFAFRHAHRREDDALEFFLNPALAEVGLVLRATSCRSPGRGLPDRG